MHTAQCYHTEDRRVSFLSLSAATPLLRRRRHVAARVSALLLFKRRVQRPQLL